MIDFALTITAAMAVAAAPPPLQSNAPSSVAAAPAEQQTRLFAVVYRPGKAWKSGRPLAEQGLGQHGTYMRELVQRGVVQAAGPLPTIEGGLVLLRASSIDVATGLMEADPAVQAGLFVGFVSEWNPLLDPHSWFARPGARK